MIESPPPSIAPMCIHSSDCDAGEICDEGICWGNPPARHFAAVLVPPEGRTDLAMTELTELDIAADGTVKMLSFAPSVTISGRVVMACEPDAQPAACDPEVSIAASIRARLASRIPGRLDYTRTAVSVAGLGPKDASFQLTLPVPEGDEPYEITIVPTRGGNASILSGTSTAELAPPKRFSFPLSGADAGPIMVTWSVGDPVEYMEIRGQVVNAVGAGMGNMQVSMLGQRGAGEPYERLSSLAITDQNGYYTLRVPRDTGTSMDLQVAPLEDGRAPTMLRRSPSLPPAPADGVPIELEPLRMPSYGAPQRYIIPIRGIDSSGREVPIAGANVRITTYLTSVLDPTLEAVFSTHAFSDDNGNAELNLIPGSGLENRTYVATVEPLIGSEHAALHDVTIDIGSDTGGLLAALSLQRRVAVTGEVLLATGEPAEGATVAARLAASFRGSAGSQYLPVIDNAQIATASTDTRGRFLLWLDHDLANDVGAVYDLELTSTDPMVPVWSVHDVDVGRHRGTTPLDVAKLRFPDAAYARGIITTPTGERVPGSVLRLYELVDEQCVAIGQPGNHCSVPPIFRGQWTSRDGDGQVTLVLPREE